MEFTSRFLVARRPSDVFAYLSAFERTLAVTAFVPDRAIWVESTTPGSGLAFDWRLEDRGPRTLVTDRLQMALPGRRLARPLVARLVRRRVAANMRRLTAQIETAR